jgi:hypothetical protein
MFSNNNSYECWSNGTTPLKTEYTHLAAREWGSLYHAPSRVLRTVVESVEDHLREKDHRTIIIQS